METFPQTDPMFNPSFDTSPFPFGSEAANLEYSILSAILGNPSPEGNPPSDSHPSSTPPPSAHPFSAPPPDYPTSWSDGANAPSLLPSEPSNFLASPFIGARGASTMFEDNRLTLPPTDRPQTGSGSSPSADFLSQSYPTLDPSSGPTTSSTHTPQDSFVAAPLRQVSVASSSQSALQPLAPRWPLPTADSAYVSKPHFLSFVAQHSTVTTRSGLELSGPKTAEEVYGSITKPYDYTEGYHFLMKVLPFR